MFPWVYILHMLCHLSAHQSSALFVFIFQQRKHTKSCLNSWQNPQAWKWKSEDFFLALFGALKSHIFSAANLRMMSTQLVCSKRLQSHILSDGRGFHGVVLVMDYIALHLFVKLLSSVISIFPCSCGDITWVSVHINCMNLWMQLVWC